MSLSELLGESRAHEDILGTVRLEKIPGLLINKSPFVVFLLTLNFGQAERLFEVRMLNT